MNKLLTCGFAAVLASAAVDSAYAEVSAKNYVQNGLVAHWDAIENAGFGQHDNAATAWKDLKGSHDLAVVDDAATWTGDSFVPPQKAYYAAARDEGSTISITDYRSIDACVTRKTVDNATCILGQGYRAFVWQKNGFA